MTGDAYVVAGLKPWNRRVFGARLSANILLLHGSVEFLKDTSIKE